MTRGKGMKGWKKGMLAAVLCVALALGAFAVPASGSAGTVYLMAVNERVLPTTAENMPTVMGGVLYVPYTMLSRRDSGINLGVNATYSTTRRTVLVSNSQIGVIFDTQSNTAKDLQDNPVPVRAMVRNSMVFLPIDWLCSYFGSISCSRVRTQYGIVVRVTNGAMVLRDMDFVDAAQDILAESLRNYLATVETPVPETPAPTPQPTPAPTPPPVQQPTAAPTTPPVQPTAEPSAPPPLQAEVLLAFRWGEQGPELAQVLEDRGMCALFLFTCEELRADEDGARRAVAAGHTVGLALTGRDAGECLAQLEEGRRLLAESARYYALVVSADGLDRAGREELAGAGCAVWTATLRGERFRSGEALVEALNPQRVNCVELSCGQGSAAFLRAALSAMEAEECRLRQASASALG